MNEFCPFPQGIGNPKGLCLGIGERSVCLSSNDELGHVSSEPAEGFPFGSLKEVSERNIHPHLDSIASLLPFNPPSPSPNGGFYLSTLYKLEQVC
jgi:hypothetical protein